MKICIYGAGAIGGWIGARLAALGEPVSVVARGATLAALHTHGLRLQQADGLLQVPVQAADNAAALGVQDLVVVAVKAPAPAEVARDIAPLLGPHTLVLTAMNGVPWWFFQGFGGAYAGTALQAVDASGAIAAAIPARHVVGCVVHASCALQAPGVVQHHFGNKLILGEPSGVQTERVQALSALLEKAAATGHLLATFNLAQLKFKDAVTDADKKSAYDLYMKAANAGLADAQYAVSQFLANGKRRERAGSDRCTVKTQTINVFKWHRGFALLW